MYTCVLVSLQNYSVKNKDTDSFISPMLSTATKSFDIEKVPGTLVKENTLQNIMFV